MSFKTLWQTINNSQKADWLVGAFNCGAESLMVCGSLAFKNKEICWQLPDLFFSDALNQWLKVNSGWANAVLKCLCLGSVSLFCYEGCFEWEGGRNAKINTLMTTRIWKVGIVASLSDLFPGRAVPFSYAAITLPSLSCPVFRRVSGLIICLSLKWGRHDPSLQPWKSGEGSGCP